MSERRIFPLCGSTTISSCYMPSAPPARRVGNIWVSSSLMGSKLFLRDTLVFWTSARQAGVPGTNSCLSLCSAVKGLVSKSKVSQVIYRGSCHSSCRGCWLLTCRERVMMMLQPLLRIAFFCLAIWCHLLWASFILINQSRFALLKDLLQGNSGSRWLRKFCQERK